MTNNSKMNKDMTQQEIIKNSLKYINEFWYEEDEQSKSAISMGYRAGIISVLQSTEYRDMELDAEKWRAFVKINDSKK